MATTLGIVQSHGLTCRSSWSVPQSTSLALGLSELPHTKLPASLLAVLNTQALVCLLTFVQSLPPTRKAFHISSDPNPTMSPRQASLKCSLLPVSLPRYYGTTPSLWPTVGSKGTLHLEPPFISLSEWGLRNGAWGHPEPTRRSGLNETTTTKY